MGIMPCRMGCWGPGPPNDRASMMGPFVIFSSIPHWEQC